MRIKHRVSGMKTIKLLAITLLLAVTLSLQNVKCPIDDSSAYFTGKTKVDVSGKLLREYKCGTFGHRFYVVDR